MLFIKLDRILVLGRTRIGIIVGISGLSVILSGFLLKIYLLGQRIVAMFKERKFQNTFRFVVV